MRRAAWLLLFWANLALPLRAQSPPSATVIPHANTPPATGAPATPPAGSDATSAAPWPQSAATPANLSHALPWRQNVFSIPFQVHTAPGSPQAPAEVQLYLSQDQGQSWRLAKRVEPQAGKFTFRAPSDGEYWFAMRTVGANGLFLDNQPLSPGLRVNVDTIAPTLHLRGQRGQSGEVELQWQIADAALDARTFKLEYQNAHDATWRPLSIGAMQPGDLPGSAVGSASFWNGQGVGVVNIRAEVSDIAGNRTVSQTKIALDEASAAAIASPNSQANPATGSETPFEQYGALAQQRPPAQQDAFAPRNSGGQQNPIAQAFPPTPSPTSPSAPQAGASMPANLNSTKNPFDRPAGGDLPGWQSTPNQPLASQPFPSQLASEPEARRPHDSHGAADDIFVAQPPTAQAWPADRVAQAPLEQTGPLASSGERYFAGRSPTPSHDAHSGVAETAPHAYPPLGEMTRSPYQPISQQRELSPTEIRSQFHHDTTYAGSPSGASPLPFDLPRGAKLRMVNSAAFELQYDTSAISSAALAKVELWGTRDGGKSWALFGEDADRQSPVPAEVQGEGVYGFRIVVHSHDGKSTRRHSSARRRKFAGVDLTAPTAVLLAAEATASDINIRWTSTDAFSAARPVSLAFGPTPQGPWTTITTGQAAHGAYTWKPGRETPELVFIQLLVVDEAGNIATSVSQQNVALPHHRPQGQILDVQPVRPSDRPTDFDAARQKF